MRHTLFVLAVALASPGLPIHGQSMLDVLRDSRLAGILMSTTRGAVQGAGPYQEATGSLRGADVLLRFGGIGVRGRLLSGDLGSGDPGLIGDFMSREVALIVGPRAIALEGGLGERTATVGDSVPEFGTLRFGLRSEWGLARGAVRISFSGGVLLRGTISNINLAERAGKDAEVSVLVQPSHRVPLFVQVGYRYETLDEPSVLNGWVEEVEGVLFMVGLRGWR